MLSALRSLRLSILRNKTIKQYLIYGIGELFLIVVGILIAQQINNWNEDRKERKLEIKTLSEIRAGLENELKDIQLNIYLHQNSTTSGEIIITHFDRSLPYSDSLAHHFAGVMWYSRFIADEGPYETLKARGLDIVSNDTLRRKIVYMYDYIYEGMKAFERNTYLDESYISSVVAKRFDKSQYHKISENRNILRGKMIPLNYDLLSHDPEYIHIVKSQIARNDFLINYFMKPTLKRLENLIVEIDNEIKQLE
jgi:hypothetical protein